jgi:ubiquinone/menaquinone biosynthesis C-methylase UbiE
MKKPNVFDYQAQAGVTKHLGGLEATKTIIEGCDIEGGERILEIGCGVGTSSVYLAREYGCQVTGVDISERMVQRARERAKANKVQHLTTFRAADMDRLPFPTNSFDVVFCESVLVFSQDKSKAVSEMARVVVPGGFVAINESIWLEEPSEELVAWFAQDMAANASTMVFEEWTHLMEQAGLTIVTWEKGRVVIKNEVRGLLQRYGWLGLLKSTFRGIAMYIRRPDYREFIADLRKSGVVPGNPEDYLGYGIITAKKNT